jgi:vacuolar protein sorting-associated protein IST1
LRLSLFCCGTPVINEDIYLELLELLELYCELLIARFGLLEQAYVHPITRCAPHLTGSSSAREPDAAVAEGVCAIIHAAPRTEIKGALPQPSYLAALTIPPAR